MQTTEDTSGEGMAGSAAFDALRDNVLCGVQAGGGRTVGDAEASDPRTPDDELCSGGSGQPDALSGFAAKSWRPYKFQTRGIEWLVTKPEAALFFPPGMGKTGVTLASFMELRKMGYAKRMLVLAPLNVCRTTWLSEPAKWGQFQGLRVGLAHGPNKHLILNDPYYDIVVLNYDGLVWALPALTGKFEVLVCDEITRLKHTTSKRFKLLKPHLPRFKFRWGLTGTPAANGLMDLFGQVYTLDQGKRLGRFITHFRMTYFHQKVWEPYRYYITREKEAQLLAKLEDLAMYLNPREWLELPGLLHIPLEVELEEAARKGYEILERDFILRFTDDSNVLAANAAVLTSKLRQYASGGVNTGLGEWKHVSDAKMDRLKDLVEEMAGEPLLIAYQFDHELIRLRTAFPETPAIRGGMTSKAITSIMEQWNAREIPILLVQPQAGALGLNLQYGGAAVCWFSLTYNLEDYIQLIDRVYRNGQTQTVRNYILTAKDTIDEVLAKTLTEKDVVQERVFAAVEDYALSRKL